MIDHTLEWLGNHPGVEVLLLIVLSVLLPAMLVLLSRTRCPEITTRQFPYFPRRRKWRDRDEHADNLGIGS